MQTSEHKICPKCGYQFGKNLRNHPPIDLMDPNEFIDSSQKELMIQKGICFICAAWEMRIKLFKKEKCYENGEWLIVNGKSYIAKPFLEKDQQKGFIGSGGRDYYFRKFDRTLIHSNNVWCQGDVPENYRNEIPDNAEIITKEIYNELISKENESKI